MLGDLHEDVHCPHVQGQRHPRAALIGRSSVWQPGAYARLMCEKARAATQMPPGAA